jgi:ATP-dependent RNA helicase DeaD
MVQLRIAAGRVAGIRPADIVGAITGEAGIPGRAVGPIEIAEHYTLVDVPEATAERVLQALKGATLKGKKVRVRLASDE